MPEREEIRRMVQGAANQAASQAVERELPLREISSTDKVGYYFSATDRNPKPGEYEYLTQGAIGFGELRITFTILVNGKPEPIVQQALEILRNLKRAQSRPGAT